MKTVAIYEAKNHLSELLAAAERGEEITITRHGTPVARLVGIAHERSLAGTDAAIASLQRIRRGRRLGSSIREAIEEGRD